MTMEGPVAGQEPGQEPGRALVSLVGAGCGPGCLTEAGRAALASCGLAVGARRVLDDAAAPLGVPCEAETAPAGVLARLERGRERGVRRMCVVLSGDTGFHSGAAVLAGPLGEAGFTVEAVPGVSSVQLLAARLGRPWQDWALLSAHGAEADPVAAAMGGRPAFFLTGGAQGPAELCARLVEAGLGGLAAATGERLGYPDERVRRATAAELARCAFDPLAVLLVEPAALPARRAPGLPDGAFQRGQVPMTKQEVRACALAKLGVGPADVCWDVGAGTGSVSVELALQCRLAVAVERGEEACALIEANRARLGAYNLRLVRGEAPEVLDGLPAPDAVFVGGSGGRLEGVLDAVAAANPRARVCVAAIALETLGAAAAGLAGRGWDVDVCQVAASRARPAGALHLLTANNPVFLVTGLPSEGGGPR